MKTYFTIILALLLFVSTGASAQEVEMADTFRSEGKIYVVIAIVLTVLAGLIIYLFTVDRKVSRIERRFSQRDQTK